MKLQLYRLLSLAAVFFSVCSCSSLLPTQKGEKEFYVLSAGQLENGRELEKTRTEAVIAGASLLIRDATGDSFVDSYRIVFARDKTSRGYYQFSQWIEPPTKKLTSLLIDRLGSSDAFSSVSRVGSSVLGTYQLNLQLKDFHHDISERPGKVVVRVEAELIETLSRVQLAQTALYFEEKVERFEARGAVEAFSKATGDVIQQLEGWLNSLPNLSQDGL